MEQELERCKQLLNRGILPETKNPFARLYIKKRILGEIVESAIYNGDFELLKYLWKLGLDHAEKQKLLLLATKAGKKKIVRFLHAKGVKDFNEALLIAVQNNDVKLVKYFVKRGASNLNTARQLATQLGHIHLMKYLE